MAETEADVRHDIEVTRQRMSSTLAELERKLNVADVVREHPWASLALAVGAGVLLSGSDRDVRAVAATVAATKSAGNKFGDAVDAVVASLVGGVHEALDERVRGWVGELKGAGTPQISEKNVPVVAVAPRAD